MASTAIVSMMLFDGKLTPVVHMYGSSTGGGGGGGGGWGLGACQVVDQLPG